ncbi:MAG: glycosyltransferase family 1 protein [Patescibacteria group bacterium]|mgnify:CR=1 FL=1
MAIQIGIDIREARPEGAGKGRYTEELTKALIKRAPKGVKFFLFTDQPHPDFTEDQILIPGKGMSWHLNLRKFLKKSSLDFYLSPTSFIVPALLSGGPKMAIVVHDMIAFLFPKTHARFPTLVEKLTLGKAIKNAQLILTVSESTWKDLKRLKPEAASKKHLLAYPGVNFIAPKKKRLKIPDSYLFAIGSPLPRKNFPRVIEAFSQVAARQKNLHLCIAGPKGNFPVPPNLKNRIHFLGYVRSEDLPELYSRAEALVFPSLYEGFGIPIIEAMAVGCPVITSNRSSMPEVADNAALLVNPESTDEIAAAIEQILKPSFRDQYRHRGLKRARQFTWESSADALLREWKIV